MSKAIRIEKAGGPDVMLPVEVTVGQPGPGEIRIRHKAVGLNYIDVYHRDGTYPLPLPLSPGMQASGVVEAVGEGVTHLRGDSAPALAMSVDPATDDQMARKPRHVDERLIDARMWSSVIQTGVVIAVVSLLTRDFYLPGGLIEGTGDLSTARTAGFTTLVVAR